MWPVRGIELLGPMKCREFLYRLRIC